MNNEAAALELLEEIKRKYTVKSFKVEICNLSKGSKVLILIEIDKEGLSNIEYKRNVEQYFWTAKKPQNKKPQNNQQKMQVLLKFWIDENGDRDIC